MSALKKALSVLLTVVVWLCTLTACGEKYKDAYIYFELLQKPQTLDPQTASSDSELLIVRNIYEGLLRKNASGEIVNGAIESYTYSGLTYTFKLKDNLCWSDGTELTANDFEYGFRRAVDPRINAPFASRLKNISGAEAVMSGSADVSTLAVNAVDKYTFQVTMCREDAEFTDTLTTSVCMPCNEEFFENSIGKYGLDAECIISNGSYRLAKWNKEDFGIRLYKNEKYNGEFDSQNAAVFISCVEDEAQYLRLLDGDSDMALLPCNELQKANEQGLRTASVENICWLMTVKSEYSPQVRQAFAKAFSTNIYSNSLPDGFKAAKSIYPQILNINTENIGITEYNLTESKAIMSAQISAMKDGKFPSAVMYYYKTDCVDNIATAIVGHWQQNLSTFINIKEIDNLSAIQNEISNSTLDFALFPVTAKSSSFYEYASVFSEVAIADTPDGLQQLLLKDNLIIPVAFQNTNISYIPTLENVIMEDGNGYIDFSFIIKK